VSEYGANRFKLDKPESNSDNVKPLKMASKWNWLKPAKTAKDLFKNNLSVLLCKVRLSARFHLFF
jgi:hypothetical protein